jgi:hypothetical protein
MRSSLFLRLAALALGSSALCGCPPPDPAVAVAGVTTSQDAQGRSRLNVIFTNGGYSDYEGDLCLRVTWVKDASFELGGSRPVRNGGEVLEETRVCRSAEIDTDEDFSVEIESKVAMVPGAFAVVVVEPVSNDNGAVVDATEVVVSAD